jgi:hypothetical protein
VAVIEGGEKGSNTDYLKANSFLNGIQFESSGADLKMNSGRTIVFLQSGS